VTILLATGNIIKPGPSHSCGKESSEGLGRSSEVESAEVLRLDRLYIHVVLERCRRNSTWERRSAAFVEIERDFEGGSEQKAKENRP